MSSDIYVVDVTTRAMHPLVTLPGMDESPIWSPDGRAIAFGSQRGQEDWMYALTLSTVPADGSAPPSHIGERELDSLSGSHMMTPVRWSEDSRYVDVVTLHDMSSHLFRVRVSDGAAERLTPRLDRYYDQFSYSRDGKRVVFVAQGVSTPADVFVSGAQKLEPKALTDCNPEWRELRVPVVDRVKWRSADGKWELNGLLLLPSDHQRNRRYPMLTNIRGGPSMVRQDLNAIYNYPLVVLAEQGYVIFIPNSRGRQGYGMELTHAIRDERNYVLNPMSDVLSGVEALVERGVADPDRLGVLGFSYGGTLTANIVTHTNRFRAAIYGEGSPNVLADIQNYGHSKFLGLNRDMWGFGNPFEPGEIERAFQQSAVYRLDKVKTPVLIEAGEKSAWEGDRQLYRGLKHFGVPSEFWVYPRSGHGWDEPLLKQDAFNRHIVWFDYWIKGKPYPDEKKRAEYDAWRK